MVLLNRKKNKSFSLLPELVTADFVSWVKKQPTVRHETASTAEPLGQI